MSPGIGGVEHREGVATLKKNPHPTVKPIALMGWLIDLVTPENAVVLDLFMGSGTTGIAALQRGHTFIGIERDPEYMQVARARIAHWAPEAVGAYVAPPVEVPVIEAGGHDVTHHEQAPQGVQDFVGA
jgi:predicted methyltransferase